MAALDAHAFDPSAVRLGQNYLLLGTDAWLIDSVSDAIRAKLKETDNADLVIVYGDEVKCAQLNDLLDSFSIFSSSKLVLLRNAEELKKAESDCLAGYFDNPSDTQSLIVVAARVDARTSAWKKIRDHSQVVACDPPKYSSAMTAWAEKELRKLGKTWGYNAKEIFVNRVELDYANAHSELQKLALLAGDRRQISEADVIRSIGSSRVGTQIDFFRALGARNARQCLELLERMLFSDWEPLQVFGQITRFYNTIYRILLLKNVHISPAEIMAKHLADVFPKQKQEYLGFAANYRLDSFGAIYEALLDTDAKLKTTAASGAVLLSACLLRLLET